MFSEGNLLIDNAEITHRHAEQPSGIMRDGKAFVGERLGSIDGSAPRAVAVQEVAALNHEILDLTNHETRTDIRDQG